ncbi:MAG: TatD family hydrolase [Brachybacterium sp.]|nr:TatD family hydrolase [Brachybacterium sp.]
MPEHDTAAQQEDLPRPVRSRAAVAENGQRRDRSWPPAPEPLPHPVIDNHCHLDFADGESERTLEDHIGTAREAGIIGQITIGSDLEAARWTARVLAAEPRLRGGVAIHPNEAAQHARGAAHDGTPMPPLDEAIAEIAELVRGPGMVTVGETGLDWFRTSKKDPQAREAQIAAFRSHIALAKETGLPMQIHDRDAHQDVLDVLDADGAPERTILHCFSGDADFARACVERGFYLSFAGNVTFSGAGDLRGALEAVGIDRVLVETDAPFLTPVPYRGRPNSSYLIPLTMAQIAASAGVDLDEACRRVHATTVEVYDWEGAA